MFEFQTLLQWMVNPNTFFTIQSEILQEIMKHTPSQQQRLESPSSRQKARRTKILKEC